MRFRRMKRLIAILVALAALLAVTTSASAYTPCARRPCLQVAKATPAVAPPPKPWARAADPTPLPWRQPASPEPQPW